MGYESVVGGRTALELRGFAHDLQLGGREQVPLYADAHPTWLARLDTGTGYVLRGTRLFVEGTEGARFGVDVETSEGTLRCSSTERAILELIDELPRPETFHVVHTLFESLGSLGPGRMNKLLSRCRSVKVKRLFFVFADRHSHAWRKYLSADEVDLGSGDRALVDGGKLHPR